MNGIVMGWSDVVGKMLRDHRSDFPELKGANVVEIAPGDGGLIPGLLMVGAASYHGISLVKGNLVRLDARLDGLSAVAGRYSTHDEIDDDLDKHEKEGLFEDPVVVPYTHGRRVIDQDRLIHHNLGPLETSFDLAYHGRRKKTLDALRRIPDGSAVVMTNGIFGQIERLFRLKKKEASDYVSQLVEEMARITPDGGVSYHTNLEGYSFGDKFLLDSKTFSLVLQQGGNERSFTFYKLTKK